MTKPKSEASKPRGFVMPPPKDDFLSPAERLAEHKSSKAHIGPHVGGRVRVAIRDKMGGEKGAEAPLVRAMYDKTTKQTRRRRRRKEKNT